jgi:2-dehydropantoate 2-reductase
MEMIIDEIFRVMQAAGYQTYWNAKEDYLAVFYNTLIPRTAEHYASMLQDLRSGKRTEIDALNGAIVDLGDMHGVVVPTNEVLFRTLKFLEVRR